MPDPKGSSTLDEHRIWELEAVFGDKHRRAEELRKEIGEFSGGSRPLSSDTIRLLGVEREEGEAFRALSEAKAEFEKQNRQRAEGATADMVSANRTMADASREAARASADAARWAKWAAIFTAVAAAGTLIATIVDLAGKK